MTRLGLLPNGWKSGKYHVPARRFREEGCLHNTLQPLLCCLSWQLSSINNNGYLHEPAERDLCSGFATRCAISKPSPMSSTLCAFSRTARRLAIVAERPLYEVGIEKFKALPLAAKILLNLGADMTQLATAHLAEGTHMELLLPTLCCMYSHADALDDLLQDGDQVAATPRSCARTSRSSDFSKAAFLTNGHSTTGEGRLRFT